MHASSCWERSAEMADKRQKRLAEGIEPFLVKPGSEVTLSKDFDPRFKAGVKKKKDGVRLLAEGKERLAEYQARLAAQDTWGVLIVLQALDAAGKDGTIRHVMSGVNPQGVKVNGFKVPSAEELGHDFLWRYGQRLPARGGSGSSTAPITRRFSWFGSIPRISIASRSRRRRSRATSGSAATARSTTGSATSPTTGYAS